MTYTDIKNQRTTPHSTTGGPRLPSSETPSLDLNLLRRFRTAVAELTNNNNPLPLKDIMQEPQMHKACGGDLLPKASPPIPDIASVYTVKK